MKRFTALTIAAVVLFVGSRSAMAVTYRVALSPPAHLALNLGTEIYPGDHGPQLSPLNEENQPESTASGGVLDGIFYDDVTNSLTFDFAYGSAFGFSDLVADFTALHIHGDGTNTALFPAVNASAGIIAGGDLGAFHTAAGTRSGRITGAVTLSATQQDWLFDNQLYINIHSQAFPPGEIRGQLVIIPEPGTICLAMVAGLPLLLALRRRRT